MTIVDTMNRLVRDKKMSPPSWILPNIHYLAVVGSVSYGASTDDSDWDIQGFCMPPKEDIFPHLKGEIPGFGLQHQRFNVYQEHHIKDESSGREYDFAIYSIIKFFQLLMENNPNIIDVLNTPSRCIVQITKTGQLVRDNRNIFFHKGAFHKFRGYAFAQMSKLDGGANRSNPRRAADIEKYGFDLKFLMHVVRLALECEQILISGELDLECNSEILKSVRRGEWTLEQGKDWFAEKEKSLEVLYANSTLPHSADESKIKNLLVQCLESHYGSLSKAGALVEPGKLEKMISDMQRVIDQYR